MWTRKDLVMMTLAATATFGVTVSVMVSQLALAAPDEAAAKTIQSPVLKIGSCELHAEVAKDASLPEAQRGWGNAGGLMSLPASTPVPAIKLNIKNPTNQDQSVTFHAVLTTASQGSPFSRMMQKTNEGWSSDYSVNLKPGESKDIDVQTKFTMAAAGYAQLNVTGTSDTNARMTALTFLVTPAPQTPAQPAPAKTVATR